MCPTQAKRAGASYRAEREKNVCSHALASPSPSDSHSYPLCTGFYLLED